MSFLFLTVAWLVPSHFPPWVNFQSEFFAFLAVGLLACGCLLKQENTLRVPAAAFVVACIALVPGVHFATGLVFFGDAFIASYYLVGFATAIAAAYACCQPVKTPFRVEWFASLAIMLLTAALASAMIGLLQWLSLTDGLHIWVMHTDPGERILANLGQPNQLASLLLLGILALAVLFEKAQVGRLALLLGTGFMTGALVLTESRTGLLSGVFVTLFLLQKQRKTLMKIRACHVMAWMAVFVLASFFLPFINEALLMADGRSIALSDQNGRDKMWQQALYAIGQSPWWGYGWNQTPVAQAVGVLKYPGSLAYTNAHNLVLDVLVWVGVPLGLLFTVFGGYWFCSRLVRVKKIPSVYAMAMLLPIAVHSMLEFPFAYAYFLLTAGLLIGVVEASLVDVKGVALNRGWAWGVLSSLTLVGVYASYEYILIEEDYRYARFENLKVGRTPEEYVVPSILLHTQLAALLTTLRQPATAGMDVQDIERLRQVSLRFGLQPLVYRYALALGLNGNPAAASRQMRVFRGMFGERSYQAAKADMQSMAAASHPELKAVTLP